MQSMLKRKAYVPTPYCIVCVAHMWCTWCRHVWCMWCHTCVWWGCVCVRALCRALCRVMVCRYGLCRESFLAQGMRILTHTTTPPPPPLFDTRRYFSAKKTKDANNKSIKGSGGILCQKQKGANPAAAMQNPSGMMNMMKNNMSFMIPNVRPG